MTPYQFADEAPDPEPGELYTDVYAEESGDNVKGERGLLPRPLHSSPSTR